MRKTVLALVLLAGCGRAFTLAEESERQGVYEGEWLPPDPDSVLVEPQEDPDAGDFGPVLDGVRGIWVDAGVQRIDAGIRQ